ncbi:MAG: hypothetical protein KF795_20620 [Labilithrix sp.]|nr:hypothetical protein [Labilithrix sp.]
MMCRRLLSLAACVASVATAGGGLAACSDSDSTPDGDTSLDAGADTSPANTDAGTPDADGAAPDPDSGQHDAGPTISSAIGSTGYVKVRDGYIIARFLEDDTIVRASNAPECVVHVRSATKAFSPAGSLTVGGAIVGADGGPEQAIVVDPDETQQYLYVPDPPPESGGVFPPTETLIVQIEGSGSLAFPLMPAQSLPSPAAGALTIAKPIVDTASADPVVISTSEPFEIVWTPPANPHADHRVILALEDINGADAAKIASLHCSFPIAAGKGSVPVNLLAELKSRVGASDTPEAQIQVLAGGYKEFTGGGASYVIEVSRDDTGFAALPAELR